MAFAKIELPPRPKSPGHPGTLAATGAGVQRRNMANALFQAIIRTRYSRVKFLLDNGVSANTKNDQGQNLLVTALYIPDQERRGKMFRYLLRRGVDCCEVDSRTGRDVLSWAACLGRPQQVKDILQTAMGEVNLVHKDNDGKTALHHATMGGHSEVVQLLVDIMDKYRLSVDMSDHDGLTPYIYARRYGHSDIADILLKRGNASSHQFDSLTFRSADSWAEIGTKERNIHARRDKVRQLAKYKIRGRLPPIQQSQQPPRVSKWSRKTKTLLDDTSARDSAMETDGQSDSSDSKTSKTNSLADSGLPGGEDTSKTGKVHFAKSRPSFHGRHNKNSSLPPLTNKSLDTAFTLWTLTHDTSDNPPTHFVGSEFDSSKSQEYGGQAGSINDLMTVLADQQTESFRKVAKPPTPKSPVFQPPPQKPKVSTLAILFGREKQHKQRQRRGKASRMGKPKPGRNRKT